jgi:cysteine sulfinate desulfinase/cysteine desulfurase-like protein
MGCGDIDAQATLRFSLGKHTTQEEMDFTVQVLKETVTNL